MKNFKNCIRWIFVDSGDELRVGWTIVAFIAAVLGVATTIIVSITWLDHGQVSRSCWAKGPALERETKYVQYTFWDYDCLVKTDGGRWIPVDKVGAVEVESGKK